MKKGTRTLSDLGKAVPVVSAGTRFGHYIIDMVLVYALQLLIISLEAPVFTVYLVVLVYYVLQEGTYQATPGKVILGNMVIDEYAQPITFSKALTRTLSRYVPFEAFSFLGARPRGWHDTWTKTFVIKRRDLERVQGMLADNEFDSFGQAINEGEFEEPSTSI